jgi:hypothetical protein
MGEPERLRLRFLGRFAAEVDAEPARSVEISGKLRRALLAYVAMQPSLAETRERLASLLWGESPDRQARQNLRQCLLDLRRDFEAVGLDPLRGDRTTIARSGSDRGRCARISDPLRFGRSGRPGTGDRPLWRAAARWPRSGYRCIPRLAWQGTCAVRASRRTCIRKIRATAGRSR